MRPLFSKESLSAVLVLALFTTLLMTTSPMVEAITLDDANKFALTGSTINANVTVGVKAGDWMEYTVTYGGSANPPESYPIWFRFQIKEVQGTNITATITYESVKGAVSDVTSTYDLKTGVLELLVVPAGLTYADVFYHEKYGNITIAKTEDGAYAGGIRTACHATVDNITIHWDKPTGIFLQSEQEFLNNDNQTVTQKVRIASTNLWINPNAINNSEMEQIVFYAKVIAVFVVVAIIVVFLLLTIRKKGK